MSRFMKAGIVDRKSYPDQLSRDFDVMWTRSLEEPAVLDQFFVTMDESEGDNFKISNIGANLDMPIANEDTEKLPYTQVAPGLSKTLTYVPYRMGVRATDTQRAMERYGKLSSMVSGLPAASMSKLEYLRVAIFDNSFPVLQAQMIFLCVPIRILTRTLSMGHGTTWELVLHLLETFTHSVSLL